MKRDILKDEEKKAEQMTEMKLLNPKNAVFKETEGGFIVLTLDGKEQGMVNVIRMFPLSDINHYLTVRTADKNQNEVGIIEDINEFDEDTRRIIEKQLSLRYFMPKILKIINIKEEFGYSYWTVMTDKGNCKFASSSGSSGSVILHGEGAIIKDLNGNRYEIEDLSKLTSVEMKKIDLYL